MSFLIKHPEDLKNLFQEDLTNEEKKTTWKDLTNLVKRRKEDFFGWKIDLCSGEAVQQHTDVIQYSEKNFAN